MVKMPKLHFYDTGLVCWLLGIRTPEQLRSHPLRGSIFESWVVSEILKHRTNAGETTGLSFYRDRDAVESDLIVEHANRLTIVEAKAGQTASASLFDGVRRVRDLLAGTKRACEAIVVYGSEEAQSRSDASLIPQRDLHENRRARLTDARRCDVRRPLRRAPISPPDEASSYPKAPSPARGSRCFALRRLGRGPQAPFAARRRATESPNDRPARIADRGSRIEFDTGFCHGFA